MRASLAAVAALFLLLTSTAVAQSPTPFKPEWPNQFDAPFGLYVQNLLFNITNRSSHFYYDWDYKRSTRIEYSNGCLPYITEKPCALVFNDAGVYLLSPEDHKPCCLLLPDIGSVPPAFLAPFNYSGQQTVEDMYGLQRTTSYWTGPEEFAYWTDATSGDDVRFQDSKPTGIIWRYGTLNYRNQTSSMFDIPSTCAKSCLFADGKTPMHKVIPHEALHPQFHLARAYHSKKRAHKSNRRH